MGSGHADKESRVELIQLVLAQQPATLRVLAQVLGMPASAVRYTVDTMRAKGLAHIGEWAPDRGKHWLVPVYHYGPGHEPTPAARARVQYLNPGFDFNTGAHLTALSMNWLKPKKTEEDEE